MRLTKYPQSCLVLEGEGRIPIHYDFFRADPDLFAHFCAIADVRVLGHGESTDLGPAMSPRATVHRTRT